MNQEVEGGLTANLNVLSWKATKYLKLLNFKETDQQERHAWGHLI